MMKKHVLFLVFMFASALVLASCGDKEPAEELVPLKVQAMDVTLADESDIVPFFRFFFDKYNEMWDKGEFDRESVDIVSERFLELVRRFPGSRYADDALFLTGKLYLDLGDYEDAKKFFEQIVDDYPDGMVSPLTNPEGYSFHIAPLAHLLVAQIYQHYYQDVPMAYWEYSRIAKKYAVYNNERYILNDTVGHVLSEAQFNMGELSRSIFGIRNAMENYQRTVLRYSGNYWENSAGVQYDYGIEALKKMYEMTLESTKAGDIALIFLNEMNQQKIYENVRSHIRYYQGLIYRDRKKYKTAVRIFKDMIYELEVYSDDDVRAGLLALEEIRKLEAMDLDYLKGTTKNLTEQVARAVVNGSENELFVCEMLLFLGDYYFKAGKPDTAVVPLETIFQRYPFMLVLNGEYAVIRGAGIARENLDPGAYHDFLKKNIFYIPEKYESKQILREEIARYEAMEKDNK